MAEKELSGAKYFPKMLIVDDDPDILECLETLFRHNHYDVSTLDAGDQIEEHILRCQPDIILLDIVIPEPDGLTLCKALKSKDRTKDIPIILLTARSGKTDIDTGMACGADHYMTKPHNNEGLLKTVSELLSRRRRTG